MRTARKEQKKERERRSQYEGRSPIQKRQVRKAISGGRGKE